MKIAIAGAGAVGGFIGACLKKAGNDVVFLARGNHLAAMIEKGLEVKGERSFIVDGEFTDDVERFSDAELSLFSVKSTDTKAMAEQVAPHLNEGAIVLTLQNGVDNEETLSAIFGADRVLAAATYMQAHIEAPGVIHNEGTTQVVIGALVDTMKEEAEKVVEVFKSAGIKTKVHGNIIESKGKKLL